MYSEWGMNGKKRLILLVYVLMRLTVIMFNGRRLAKRKRPLSDKSGPLSDISPLLGHNIR